MIVVTGKVSGSHSRIHFEGNMNVCIMSQGNLFNRFQHVSGGIKAVDQLNLLEMQVECNERASCWQPQ